eukprot:CAMPEP_0201958986 /NCGR_PEP_ID=MMETSP0904-20121228/6039_1 /ASSEMBLY_ACC=CAM_ASM_000553 /TAXON_ID=420261 /ORGANISM="Thalassiosira antarctica, Strain CCMP982" /LENGTH=211 /DNA_ID=CAMNT_0048504495 /DNA_START=994 /DNA_END=1627 /DNA_ORIENTATION=-
MVEPSRGAVVNPPSFVLSIRGGANKYETKFEIVKCSVVGKASRKIEEARRKIVDKGTTTTGFKSKADKICTTTIKEFAKAAPTELEGSSASSAYARKLQELELSLDAPLQLLYLQQLSLLREKVLVSYKTASKASKASDYEAMLATDGQLLRAASSWTYGSKRLVLQSIMGDFASSSKNLTETQGRSSQQQSTAMQFLQHQQQMIQQLQQQ